LRGRRSWISREAISDFIGVLHAYDKPPILLNRKGAFGGESATPFDVSTHQRLEYAG
jgi:hypothetical protein